MCWAGRDGVLHLFNLPVAADPVRNGKGGDAQLVGGAVYPALGLGEQVLPVPLVLVGPGRVKGHPVLVHHLLPTLGSTLKRDHSRTTQSVYWPQLSRGPFRRLNEGESYQV